MGTRTAAKVPAAIAGGLLIVRAKLPSGDLFSDGCNDGSRESGLSTNDRETLPRDQQFSSEIVTTVSAVASKYLKRCVACGRHSRSACRVDVESKEVWEALAEYIQSKPVNGEGSLKRHTRCSIVKLTDRTEIERELKPH